MTSGNKLKALMPALLLAVIAVLVLGIIAILPYDRPAAGPSNSYLNLANGGFVATDGSMTYYINGKGELRCKSEQNNYYIASAVDTVCPYGVGVIFRTEKGEVKYADYDGGNKQTLTEGAKQMTINGNWVFYSDKDGKLNKYFIKTGETHSVGLTVDSFLIARTSVLYLKDGTLYTARTDGSEVTPFFSEKVDSFSRFDSYIFYKKDGVLYSVASGNTAAKQTYCEVDSFNINSDGVLFFTKDGELYSLDITNEDAEQKLLDTHGKVSESICCIDNRVYFYSAEGKLQSCLADGSEIKTVE